MHCTSIQKKRPFFLLIPLLLLTTAGIRTNPIDQKIQHDVSVINIEVPVRVFSRSTFIDDLTREDFLLYEEDELQDIEALYLVHKNNVRRKEETKSFSPDFSRYFVLVFIISEYLPKIDGVLDVFFDRVYLPADNLQIITPVKAYHFKKESLRRISKDRIKDQLRGIIRKDAVMGNLEYRNLVKDLQKHVLAGDGEQYGLALDRLEILRYIHQNKLSSFAEYLKSLEEQKHVFLFYQQETIPVLDFRTHQDMNFDASRPGINSRFFDSYFESRFQPFNTDFIKKAFSDASISVHLLYITKSLMERVDPSQMASPSGRSFVDISNDLFQSFYEMAEATGGTRDSSANMESAFEKSAFFAENYYLLYYSPKNYKKDEKFKRITVKIKSRDYKISHRLGYIAD